jgi:hypothetical protein
MKHGRVLVAIIVVVVWGLFVPFAMASSHCPTMSAMCEGPCGASWVASIPVVSESLDLVAPVYLAPLAAAPSIQPPVLELPPKSFPPSV